MQKPRSAETGVFGYTLFNMGGRVGKGISAQASHRTVREALTSYGSSLSVLEESNTLLV